jgi:PAS domain S-box-containing protein
LDNILYEYKGAIDTSFIVSKTDIDGKIIYINKKFCEISGYSYDELIGKPHNIVRHPDMSAAAFEEMWRTILDKKTWRGRITNLKKSGDPYIVESVVSPIFYPDGEIKEFIAIRYDVTKAVAVGKKLIEEKQARKEQEILNEALHKINAAKDSFLLVFTHELKTPLNAVINFSDYINNELKDKGKDFEELVELKIMNNNKVDHPRKKSKDLADAVCGAVFGAISHTPRDLDLEVEIHTFKDRPKDEHGQSDKNVIQYRSQPSNKEVADYLSQFNLL